MDFSFSDRTDTLIAKLEAFMAEHIVPNDEVYKKAIQQSDDPWQVPALMEELKAKAREQGLWNLFMPGEEYGAGLNNSDYAPLAEIMGRYYWCSEVFNCSAPDTGNMEVLEKYGTDAQKKQWLEPLLEGKIRSSFCMTEPNVASSDATNLESTIVEDGDELVLNGRKWWITGIGHPNCEILIFMGVSNPEADRHSQHAMVLVPRFTEGVEIVRHLPVFGQYDEPVGHSEVDFNNVRVPRENIILGLGRGFEIAQGRLGPGRIHHCMRCIGLAEAALELMVKRGMSRSAFGKPIINLGGNRQLVAKSRMEIDQARLLTLKAAYMMDTVGTFGALSEISQIKVVAPNVAQQVVERAIQMHGAEGLSDDTPLAEMYGVARCCRMADGPDEVHEALVGRLEIAKYR